MVVGRWYVQCAAIWYCICYYAFRWGVLCDFLLFLSIPFSFLKKIKKSAVSKLEWSVIYQHVLAFCAHLTVIILKGL